MERGIESSRKGIMSATRASVARVGCILSRMRSRSLHSDVQRENWIDRTEKRRRVGDCSCG